MNSSDDLDFGQTIRGFAEGQMVFGRYTLRHILGRGGMGVVWLAWDGTLERDVALKFLPEMLRMDAEAVRDLKRETRRGLELAHPHIVKIYDFVDDANSVAIAMEYIDGTNLSAMKVQQERGCFDAEEIKPSLDQIFDALTYAHERAQIVHRDIKPHNLMVNQKSEVKIADFGISRCVSDSMSRVSIAPTGTSGSPPYMSPQQALGRPASITDDIYSLGATIFELLTGKPPFYSGNIAKQIDEVIPPSMTARRVELGHQGAPIPPAWESAVAACLAKDPSQRPQSVRELNERLSGAAGNLPPPSPLVLAPTPRKRIGPLALIAGLLLLTGVAAAGWYFGVHLPAEEARREEIALQEARTFKEKETRDAEARLQKEAEEARVAAAELASREAARVAEENRVAEEERVRQAEANRKQEEAAKEATRLAALPKTLVVPDEFSSVQEAIDQARSGDTVMVKPGIYKETLTMKDGVRLLGTEAGTCRIESEEGAAAILTAIHCPSGTIENLTFQGNGKSENPVFSVGWKGKVKDSGVVVEKLEANGPAARAGIRVGARVVSIDGTNIGSDWNSVCYLLALGGRSREVEIVTEFSGTTQTHRMKTEPFSISGNWPDGLVIFDSTITISGCTVERAGGLGINVTDGTVTISDCTVERAGGDGIYVGGLNAHAKIQQTQCLMNGSSGIQVSDSAKATIENCRSIDNAFAGICIRGKASCTARSNTFSKNKHNGINVSQLGTHAELIDNRCEANERPGIYFSDGAGGLVQNNTSEGNSDSGINIRGRGTNPRLSANRFINNSEWGLAYGEGATPQFETDNFYSGNEKGTFLKNAIWKK